MKFIFNIMEKTDTILGKAIDTFLIILIFLNIIIVVLDSFISFHNAFQNSILIFEAVSVAIFSIEFILRLISSPYHYSDQYKFIFIFRYLFSPMAIIDLLAILPFYLPLIFPFDLRILRIMRVFRLIRVLKIKRYSKAIDLITSVFMKKRVELLLSSFILIIVVFLISSMLYYVENETQPEYFPNIFESLKWSIKTMIFLGFEPSNPLTPVGNILGMLLIVFGLGWLTLPISIISSGFIEEISTKKNCPHCGKEL